MPCDGGGHASLLGVQSREQAGGVVLEDLGPDLGLDVELVEVGQPAVRGDDRVVRAEQDLVLQQGVRVPDELRREVLRRPAGQVDVDVRLVRGDRERLVLPGERRVREDDPQVREVHGDVVDQHRVRVLEPDAAAAGHAGADAGLSACGTGPGTPSSSIDLVQRVGHPVVRREALEAGMELEAAHAVLLDQPACLADGGPALPRVDARERDQHVRVRGAALGDLLVGDARVAGRVLGVHGEDDRGHVAFPVVGGDLADRRLPVGVRLKYSAEALEQLGAQRAVAVAADLGVGVDVDGDQSSDVHRSGVIGASGSAGRPYVSGAPSPAARSAMAAAFQPPSANTTAFSCGCDHSASLSPPMPIACPVTSFAASEARKATRAATSSTVPEPLVPAEPARQRLAGPLRLLDQRREGRDGPGHLGGRDRHDRVDGDVRARQLQRPGTGHGDDAGLGGRVVGLPEVAALPGGRGDQDQPAAGALLAHADRGSTGAGERAAQVHVDDGVEVVVGHLPQHPVAQDAGVGDQDVEPPERVDRRGDQQVGGLGVADRRDHAAPAARCSSATAASAAASTSLTTTEAPARRAPPRRPGRGRGRSPVTIATFPDRSMTRYLSRCVDAKRKAIS